MKHVKTSIIIGNLNTSIGNDHLKFCICCVNKLAQTLLDHTSIFYHDAELGKNAITFEPLLAGNKSDFFYFEAFIIYISYISKFNSFFTFSIFFHFDG